MQWILPAAPSGKLPGYKRYHPVGAGNCKEAVAHSTVLKLRLRTRKIAADVFLRVR